jgi:HemY protein
MLRILIFLLSIVFFAFAVTYLASLDNRITGEAFGYKFDGPSGIIVGGLLFAFAAAIYLTHKIKDMLDIPRKLKAREAETRRARGVAALTRGLEAVAVGDAADASHHAKVAQRNLGDMALTRLLTAQAAQLSGDEKAAQESFTAMLEAPETEFLGLKGLYLQAIKAGEARAARDFAERAFRLRGNAQWAFESVYALSLERGAWGDAREALAQGRRNHLIETEKADRANAALLTADAYAAAASDDRAGALRETQAALKLAPGLTPAAALFARIMNEDGKAQNAAKIIENAFAAEPHPALVRIYDRLYADELPEKRAKKLQFLAEKNPTARESQTLKARAHVLLGEFSEAVAVLEPLMGAAPTAFDFALMAQATAGLSGADAGRRWLERAAAAPRDPRPGADGEFHFTRAGWARLVREYMEFGRLCPPPLEDAVGMSAEEIRLLTAPPPPDAEAAQNEEPAKEEPATPKQIPAPAKPREAAEPADARADEDDHIHDDEEAARAAAAAREVS